MRLVVSLLVLLLALGSAWAQPITRVGTTGKYDADGQGIRIDVPAGTSSGDVMMLILHRTDDDLPLKVSGWTRVAECFKTDNPYDCATEKDCTSWHNSDYCETFSGNGRPAGPGHDLAQSIFYRVAGGSEPASYSFNLNRDSVGKPGWISLTTLRGAATTDPVRNWAGTGCDGSTHSKFPSVNGEAGDMLLLSQSFDDLVPQSTFLAPDGTALFGYVGQDDEAGFLFGGVLSTSGQTGVKQTTGPGAPNSGQACKDALLSLTVRPANAPPPPPPSCDQTISIAEESDDAEQPAAGGPVNCGSSDLELVRDAADQVIGLRFKGVNLDSSTMSRVSSVRISFTNDESETTLYTEATNLVFHGDDADDSRGFCSGNGDIISRTKTSAVVAWNNLETFTGSNQYSSPDLKGIVQEIVSRPGWSAGNNMTFIISGSGKRVVDAYQTSTPPKLIIEAGCGTTGSSSTLSMSSSSSTSSSSTSSSSASGSSAGAVTGTAGGNAGDPDELVSSAPGANPVAGLLRACFAVAIVLSVLC